MIRNNKDYMLDATKGGIDGKTQSKYLLVLESMSFLVCFNTPYQDRHNSWKYPAIAISFTEILVWKLTSLVGLAHYRNKVLKMILVHNTEKIFLSDYNMNYGTRYGDIFLHLNMFQFTNWIKERDEDIKDYIVVFHGFDDWRDIVSKAYLYGRMRIEGSDSSTRHMFNDFSLRLAGYLSILSNDNFKWLEGLVVKDKKLIKPGHDRVNIEAAVTREESLGAEIYYNNVYVSYKDYAIKMEKYLKADQTLSSCISDKNLEFIPLINLPSTLSNEKNNVSSTPQSNIKSFDPNQKRNFHMSTISRGEPTSLPSAVLDSKRFNCEVTSSFPLRGPESKIYSRTTICCIRPANFGRDTEHIHKEFWILYVIFSDNPQFHDKGVDEIRNEILYLSGILGDYGYSIRCTYVFDSNKGCPYKKCDYDSTFYYLKEDTWLMYLQVKNLLSKNYKYYKGDLDTKNTVLRYIVVDGEIKILCLALILYKPKSLGLIINKSYNFVLFSHPKVKGPVQQSKEFINRPPYYLGGGKVPTSLWSSGGIRSFSSSSYIHNNSVDNPYIYFKSENSILVEDKECKSINCNFVNDVLYVYLPTINYENKYNKYIGDSNSPNFSLSLKHLLDSLDNRFVYNLDFNLLVYTNDKNKKVLSSNVEVEVENQDNTLDFLFNMAKDLLKTYEFNGYSSVYKDKYDRGVINTDSFVHNIIFMLSYHVTKTNEDLEMVEFLMFKKGVLLVINRSIKDTIKQASDACKSNGLDNVQIRKYSTESGKRKEWNQNILFSWSEGCGGVKNIIDNNPSSTSNVGNSTGGEVGTTNLNLNKEISKYNKGNIVKISRHKVDKPGGVEAHRCFSTTTGYLTKNRQDNSPEVNGLNVVKYDTSKSVYGFSLFLFTKIINLLENEPMNEETQLKIERFLHNQFKDFLSNKEKNPLIMGVDTQVFNSKFNKFCIDKVKELLVYLGKSKNILNSDKNLNKGVDSLSNNETLNYLFRNIVNKINENEFINIMLYTLFLVATHNGIIDTYVDNDEEMTKNKTAVLANTLYMGKNIVNVYIRTLYKEYLNSHDHITYTTFKSDLLNKGLNKHLIEEEFYLHIGSHLIEIMISCDILVIKVHSAGGSSRSVLELNNNISSLLDNNVNRALSIPLNLPMIVKPKPYGEGKYGGYLLNGVEYEEPLFTKKIGYGKSSEIDEKGIQYFVINKMMETPFKINKDLLMYLREYNNKHKLLIDPKFKQEAALRGAVKRNKYQEKEYQQLLSKNLLEEYIINIANTYSNVPEIYFPIKLDNRGRLYPKSAYFHYQGSELAKALILFARPDTIKRTDREAIEYLKAYGATCFGNGLNRKSYSVRLEWVEKHWNEILEFDKSDLVNKADEKYLFLSFCLEMRRFDNYLNNENIYEFKTYLPIQLDGTCNGFQHLALLSNETKLFESLNLFEAKKSDDPKDFYEHIIKSINIYLESLIASTKSKINELEYLVRENKENYLQQSNTEQSPHAIEYTNRIEQICNLKDKIESLGRLLNLGLSRSNIKPAVMTKPYNAKDKSLVSYIKDTLIFDHSEDIIITNKEGEKVKFTRGWYKIQDYSKNYVNHSDIELLVNCLNEILYLNYPRIKQLTIYLNEIGKILNKLNLPIVWRLPNGLMVSQKYMLKHTKQVKPFSYLKTSLTLTITDKVKIDKSKQLTALMPNLVHSLDAATLSLLYNSFYNSVDNNVNFYSVHDCYGVTAKYVDLLISLLRTIYINLYSDKGYIQKFDSDVINLIMGAYGEKGCNYCADIRTIHIGRRKIKLPPISHIIENEFKEESYKSLSKAKFFIK